MKNLVLTTMILLLLAGLGMAQNDPFGNIDTLYLDQITAAAGQECVLNVNMWNDEELGGLTIPLIYPKEKLDFVAVDFAGGRIAYINTKPVTIDEQAGTILVGAIVFFEAWIQPGDGKIFSIRFRVKEDLPPGEIITIDTTAIPPAWLLFTHSSATSNFVPAVVPGAITVAEENRPPAFDPIPELYVSEGDSLIIEVVADDPEGDSVILANPGHPHNSVFTDNGNGTARFAWRPDYIGPYSSLGGPFELVFWASDGDLSNNLKVKVNVINVNRQPEISCPDLIEAEAGDSLNIEIIGVDPDFETIDWDITGLPAGASFDHSNPGHLIWVSDYADSGMHVISLTATDPHGLSDVMNMVIDLAPVTLFALQIDTVTTFTGRTVNLSVFLKNEIPISEFEIVMNFDAAVISPLGVTNDGSRCEQFEFFEYLLNDNGVMGDVRIIGKADILGGPVGAPIAAGDGLLCRVMVQISPNLAYVGSQIPVRFVTRGPDDNILINESGETIETEQINLFDGSILIQSPGVRQLGDINLNGLVYEISDAVYFSNFFISPRLYPLNDQQVVNSDINRDGLAPSVADLVLIIQIITGEKPPPIAKILPLPDIIDVQLIRDDFGVYVQTSSAVDIGGAFFAFGGADADRITVDNMTAMDMLADAGEDKTSCLLISYTQATIASGSTDVVRISNDPRADIVLLQVDLADDAGRVLHTQVKEQAIIPDEFVLHQNFPNPFNPTTMIQFELQRPEYVALVVYNVLGQEVIQLADGEFPAGSHAVVWDGVDREGRSVASGMYLYKLTAGDFTASRKMVLMK